MPQPIHRVTFFQGFLRNPKQVGSIIPSSRFLERRIVRTTAASSARTLVELGPGTGGTTRAVLDAMPADSRLLAIEANAEFARVLEEFDDPRLIPHHGSAEDIADILREHELPAPEVVFSGIPFSTMPKAVGQGIIRAVWDSLAEGGRFVAYQFRDQVMVLGRELLGDPEVELELLNVPPMHFYSWHKPNGAAGNGHAV
ncbi:class I SAM-dependent methyltransferase [Spiribacter halobius]|uniref:Methyltransferase type 12 n=1 Tax=Sediminicurvatus halobius TaxID=2182432 RepID=A0A2U2MWT7_9GAMM|nr:methyltransferase type 12 [Spiribacter halobius]PWG61323.1 methyltransferase type 12 [Spiribacter halobius]UEX79701.1 methyltransferase type 12 [Spiribacter halobius]